MILFVAFICFLGLLGSVFLKGHVNIELYPYFQGQYSYMETVAIVSLVIIAWLVFVKMLKKIVLGPLGWYNSFSLNRQKKAANKALQGYMIELGGQQEGAELFLKHSKTLANNPFYWMCAFMSDKEDLAKLGYKELAEFENGEFCELMYKVNNFLDKDEYKSALMLLESAGSFPHRTVWFWQAIFTCYIELEDFEKAELALKPLRSLGEKDRDYELILRHALAENDIDKLENLERCFKLDETMAVEYVKELLHLNQKDKARKVIQEVWEDTPNLELGLLLDEVYVDLVAVERFSAISDIVNLQEDSIAAEYLLARSALDAGLFLIAREKLMELAKEQPLLAFPLLAKLEKVEKHDLEASNRWLEKAVKHLNII